ncbi:MAG: transcriptional regulator [Methylobacter sp.]|nr:MAG: transcriptional regulator [Methylobacter sp.]PPD23342.1 MAG: transcriptional regulator [Methylobacter sp.]
MNQAPQTEAVWEFPCQFPVKAMGRSSPELELVVIEIIRRHSPETQSDAVRLRPSKAGNYTSVTVVIEAFSKQQIDAIYQDLTDSPHILVTL